MFFLSFVLHETHNFDHLLPSCIRIVFRLVIFICFFIIRLIIINVWKFSVKRILSNKEMTFKLMPSFNCFIYHKSLSPKDIFIQLSLFCWDFNSLGIKLFTWWWKIIRYVSFIYLVFSIFNNFYIPISLNLHDQIHFCCQETGCPLTSIIFPPMKMMRANFSIQILPHPSQLKCCTYH